MPELGFGSDVSAIGLHVRAPSADQMPTSAAPSRVPPNHAATRPSRVSTIVDACALANGAVSNTNSELVGGTITRSATTSIAGSAYRVDCLTRIDSRAILARVKSAADVNQDGRTAH